MLKLTLALLKYRSLCALIGVMTSTFQLILVRHGETEANRAKILQGQKDVGLSEVGRHQAQLVAERLATEHFIRAYSSDLSRAAESVDIVAAELPNPPIVVRDQRLRERGFGSYEGKPVSYLVQAAHQQKVPVAQFTPPGGESLAELRTRAEDFFQSLCCDCAPLLSPQSAAIPPTGGSQPSVLVVSHGGLMRVLMELFQQRFSCQLPPRLPVSPNAAVSVFTVVMAAVPEPRCQSVQAVCIHDSAHLKMTTA